MAILLFAGGASAQTGTAAPAPPASTAQSGAPKPAQHHSAKRKKTKTPEPQVVQPPPPPPTPEQMAPVAPTVTYQGGQLSIQSNNATLAQVLRSVQSKLGASFDIPGNATDRVVAQLGPGQPKDVLATLLDGSKFNYIILGSPNEPGSVQKLILTPRQNIPTTNTAQNRPAPQPQPEPQQEEDYNPPEPVEDNTANQGQPPGGFRPGYTPNQPNGEQPENGQLQQGAKTPEQLLQELQRMQQQQQQYQQQLNPANQNPQPQLQPQ